MGQVVLKKGEIPPYKNSNRVCNSPVIMNNYASIRRKLYYVEVFQLGEFLLRTEYNRLITLPFLHVIMAHPHKHHPVLAVHKPTHSRIH